MTIDLEKALVETPGSSQVLHFNNAGAALMPQPVLDAMIGHLELEAHIGGYEAADQEASRIGASTTRSRACSTAGGMKSRSSSTRRARGTSRSTR